MNLDLLSLSYNMRCGLYHYKVTKDTHLDKKITFTFFLKFKTFTFLLVQLFFIKGFIFRRSHLSSQRVVFQAELWCSDGKVCNQSCNG